MISPDSFLMLIIICLFLCLLICLGPFLASSVSSINSFLFLRALVLRLLLFCVTYTHRYIKYSAGEPISLQPGPPLSQSVRQSVLQFPMMLCSVATSGPITAAQTGQFPSVSMPSGSSNASYTAVTSSPQPVTATADPVSTAC